MSIEVSKQEPSSEDQYSLISLLNVHPVCLYRYLIQRKLLRNETKSTDGAILLTDNYIYIFILYSYMIVTSLKISVVSRTISCFMLKKSLKFFEGLQK